MKIATYKVPCTITRDPKAGVVVNLRENEKTREPGDEVVPESEQNNIPNIAKSLSDQNSVQMELAKNTLLSKEKSSEGFVLLKYLEG